MTNYAAFLRGINVGGHKPVPMEKLKKTFEALHFTGVRTILASGNVLFASPRKQTAHLEHAIEAQLERTFLTDIGVHVRTIKELEEVRDKGPFHGMRPGPDVRLYVTFVSGTRSGSLTTPRTSPDGHFKILKVTPRTVFSSLAPSPTSRTVDVMKILERDFGKDITSRSFGTILRVLGASS